MNGSPRRTVIRVTFNPLLRGIAVALLVAAPAAARAQTVIRLWPGVAPGSEHWTQQERVYENTPVGTVVQNVVTPTLTAYLPPPERATGTAVIVAPGGYFIALAISYEGEELARWLQSRGIAAFLLRYRTLERRESDHGIPQMDMDTAARYAIADAMQAMRVVRRHAAEWRVRPERIGFLGFSAGGMVSSAVALQPDSAARPAFAGVIYGAPFGVMPAIPANPPPLFLAWAQDDQVALAPVERFYAALRAAGVRPEAHIYSAGGHGFGTKHQGTSSDHWIDDFYAWLEAQGLTRASGAATR
jgi:acetyl esterase/lipase